MTTEKDEAQPEAEKPAPTTEQNASNNDDDNLFDMQNMFKDADVEAEQFDMFKNREAEKIQNKVQALNQGTEFDEEAFDNQTKDMLLEKGMDRWNEKQKDYAERDEQANSNAASATPEADAPAPESPEPEAAAVSEVNPKEKPEKDNAEKEQKAGQPVENAAPETPKPGAGKSDKKMDPMMELVEDLKVFVAEINGAINDFIKEKGQAVWDKLQDTGPMKTLNGALDDAKGFIKDKVDKGIDKVQNSDAVTSAKDLMSDIKNQVTGAFSDVMNAGANAIASGVQKITKPEVELSSPASTETMQSAQNDVVQKTQESGVEADTAAKDKPAPAAQEAPEVDTPSMSV